MESMKHLFSSTTEKPNFELKLDGALYSGRRLSDKFNVHLSSGASPALSMNYDSYQMYIKPTTVNSIFLSPTYEIGIYNWINSLENNSASGFGNIKSNPIKLV